MSSAGFSLVGSSQLGLDLINGGHAAFEFLGKLFQILELSDPYRGGHITERILDNKFLLRLAENKAYARLIAWMFEKIVHRGEIEVHLAGVLGLERAAFQIDHHKAAETKVVEEEIDFVVFSRDFERILATNERKPDPQLKKETPKVRQKPASTSRSCASAERVKKSKL